MSVIKVQFSLGWCLNHECKNYNQSVFLSWVPQEYICRLCSEEGRTLAEKQWPERYDNLDFYQVRLEFDYSAPEDLWQGLCVVTDESYISGRNIWNIRNPNIKTEKHAKKTATDALAYLQRATESVLEPGICIRNTEMMLDFCVSKEQYGEDLDRLLNTLRRSRLCKDHRAPPDEV